MPNVDDGALERLAILPRDGLNEGSRQLVGPSQRTPKSRTYPKEVGEISSRLWCSDDGTPVRLGWDACAVERAENRRGRCVDARRRVLGVLDHVHKTLDAEDVRNKDHLVPLV